MKFLILHDAEQGDGPDNTRVMDQTTPGWRTRQQQGNGPDNNRVMDQTTTGWRTRQQQGDRPDNNRVMEETTTAKSKQLILPRNSFRLPLLHILCQWTTITVVPYVHLQGLVQHTAADTDSKVSSATIPTIYVDSSCGLSIPNI